MTKTIFSNALLDLLFDYEKTWHKCLMGINFWLIITTSLQSLLQATVSCHLITFHADNVTCHPRTQYNET